MFGFSTITSGESHKLRRVEVFGQAFNILEAGVAFEAVAIGQKDNGNVSKSGGTGSAGK